MPDLSLTLADEAATRALGRVLGEAMRPGDVIWLEGDLGAGKTTLAQGLGEALGVPGPVTSPTFALVQEHEGRLLMRHIDLYRLEPAEVPPLGPWEWFEDDAVVVVEWPCRLPEGLPCDLRVVLESGEVPRRARLQSCTERGGVLSAAAGALS
ncbi:MAG: tRNA (adenosine(37)-N6)-threonylcarbamoyltransferase complex ATPase subunit type 1 TsaE [Candidatus Sericytochromatia bacterium]|nr:tRNA (adenosine(37)-N6)-threonylcarbamoyltransferase complex ATPase subunit type 1 TsaE [Candidatus Sericytochromatia bacterium]